jgi:hypothetical protein
MATVLNASPARETVWARNSRRNSGDVLTSRSTRFRIRSHGLDLAARRVVSQVGGEGP